MKIYIGTNIVRAKPMTRGEYNDLRIWDKPIDESGDDEGYLVEYIDGGKRNHPDFTGYITWTTKAQFDGAYLAIGGISHLPPYQQRVVAEMAQLDDKRVKLLEFMDSKNLFVVCNEAERIRLSNQYRTMTTYSKVLNERIKAFNLG
jgi:hypothetical protein